MHSPDMTATQAAAILGKLATSGVRCWVMGGWGVDALVGRPTRTHHDLDLLVRAHDLHALDLWLAANGFAWQYDWDENRSVELEGKSYSTAFVSTHADGRELDIHGVWVLDDQPVLATTDPWMLPADGLSGRGTIDGLAVACVSREAQRAMHVGYTLPAHHLADLRNLGLG